MEIFLRGLPAEDDDYMSGEGGLIEVYDNQTTKNDSNYWDWEDWESDISDKVEPHKPFEFMPDGYLAIHADWGLGAQAHWIMNNPGYIQRLNNSKDSPHHLFYGWLKDYWEEKWNALQEKMANIKSDRELKEIWDEYERTEQRYRSVQQCLEYEAGQT